MAVQRLLDYLNQTHTYYYTLRHKSSLSALSAAKEAHIPGNDMVKSILIRLDDSFALAVLPSTSRLNFKKIKEITGAKTVTLADEKDIENLFPDCSLGAIPPLGNLYHMPVIGDSLLNEKQDIFFEAGSHREIMKIHTKDFIKLTHPKIAPIHRIY